MSDKAERLLKERIKLGEDVFADVSVWTVPERVRGSTHRYKYALAYVVAGKGDHRHLGTVEAPYVFVSIDQLIDDFWTDVTQL
ncbi:MAG: hypothetical protein EPN72_06935 [Nevskiaceae bacterium]|nr:MAG: hypothetical protein EPN63_10635 [Nevskiaceae bacterium]TBR73413.1 MAG: hypothetical protein EPN72_06935 [Nevskiaceae bacterium]